MGLRLSSQDPIPYPTKFNVAAASAIPVGSVEVFYVYKIPAHQLSGGFSGNQESDGVVDSYLVCFDASHCLKIPFYAFSNIKRTFGVLSEL